VRCSRAADIVAGVIVVHAYIEVTDAEAGLAFYCDGLGLQV
jgi:hypothetical protein